MVDGLGRRLLIDVVDAVERREWADVLDHAERASRSDVLDHDGDAEIVLLVAVARAHLALGHDVAAARAAEKAMVRWADDPEVAALTAVAQLRAHLPYEALRTATRVRELVPGAPAGPLLAAEAHLALGRPEHARSAAATALDLGGNPLAVRMVEARAAVDLGDHRAARRASRAAASTAPDRPEAAVLVALVQRAGGIGSGGAGPGRCDVTELVLDMVDAGLDRRVAVPA